MHLVYHRQYLCELAKNYVELCISYYFPKEPEPSSPRTPVYVSDETREAINKAKADAAASAADSPDEDAGDEDVDLEGSPRVADSAPGAHGVGLDEPMEAAAPMRNSPRRQQMFPGMLMDDGAMDKIGVLDNAAARVVVRTYTSPYQSSLGAVRAICSRFFLSVRSFCSDVDHCHAVFDLPRGLARFNPAAG